MTMIAQRIIAPSTIMSQQQHHHHQQQQQQQHVKAAAPVIRFSGSDVKNTYAKISPKRLNTNNPVAPYTTGPLPSIERRNARERNRVKQVNNGFDKLRQYIPTKIVEAENGGRGQSKKLSKVDTLKMAVKYIQRLKEMLDENNSRLPQSSVLQSPVSTVSSGASSYYSASPAPSSVHIHQQQPLPQMIYPNYASTPISDYQTYSEAPVSPAPSYHSDVSSHHHSVYQMPMVAYQGQEQEQEQEVYAKGYSQAQFEDDDSGSFEEEGILDDILQWQMQH